MKMNAYVNFAGSCAEAFRYYEKHLGAKIGMMMTHAQSPEQGRVNPEWKDAILHARISIGDTELMAADINVGVLVMLKSGGPDMTVESIQPDGWAVCSWFEGSKPMKQAFGSALRIRLCIAPY